MQQTDQYKMLLAVESLVLEVTEAIAKLMSEQGVDNAELAKKLGKSTRWVTRMLSGATRITLLDLAQIMHALNAKAVFSVGEEPPDYTTLIKARQVFRSHASSLGINPKCV